jgi:hypothetical protein
MKTLLVGCALLYLSLLATAGTAQTSSVPWSACMSGFLVSTSSSSMLKSAVGQPFVGTMQGSSSKVQSGFLADTLFHTLVSVSQAEGLPGEFALQQNYPNPFNPKTAVSFQLPAASKTKIAIYDMLGREVTVLVDEQKNPGGYEVTWDASGFSTGVYICRMTAGDFVASRRMVLVK